MADRNDAVVLVHGLFSSADAWRHFSALIEADEDLSNIDVLNFEYQSPKFKINPVHRIPSYNVLADSLQTFLEIDCAKYHNIALVSHSQGGLIIQRYLARMLHEARGRDLARIKRVVMFACPNSGSELFLLLRQRIRFWRNPQERDLRPVNEDVTAAQKLVMNRIIHAQRIAEDQCPIHFYAYAGEIDNVVTPTSAKSVFPNTGVIPGDHSTIIQPDSAKHRSYTVFKSHLLAAFSPLSSISPPVSENGREPRTDQPTPLPYGIADAHASKVIASWNGDKGTVEFILSPEVALTWIKDLQKGGTNEQ